MTASRRVRWLAIAVATLFAARNASAQAWTFGVNAGVGQGGFSGSQEFTWTHFSPAGSVFLTQPFAWGLWLQPELGFSRKSGVSTTPISTLTLSADYLDLPLLLQLRFRGNGPVSPFVQVGPGVTIRMRCTLAFVGSGVDTKDDCDVVRGETSQRVDATITGGLGVAMYVGNARLTLEGRASTGLLTSAAPVDASNPRSFGLSFLVGASRVLRRGGPAPATPGRRPALPGLPPAAAENAPAAQPELPPIASASIIVPDAAGAAPERPSRDPLAALGPTRLVTVHATNADVRSLLVAVAREAGLDLVIDGDVRARVSVALTDVPAADAIRAIITSAGLALSGPSSARTATPAVFYQLPVNIDRASAATIAARFGTSAELANFLVESRPQAPRAP